MNKKFDRRNFVKLSTSGTSDEADSTRDQFPGESSPPEYRLAKKHSGWDS